MSDSRDKAYEILKEQYDIVHAKIRDENSGSEWVEQWAAELRSALDSFFQGDEESLKEPYGLLDSITPYYGPIVELYFYLKELLKEQ